MSPLAKSFFFFRCNGWCAVVKTGARGRRTKRIFFTRSIPTLRSLFVPSSWLFFFFFLFYLGERGVEMAGKKAHSNATTASLELPFLPPEKRRKRWRKQTSLSVFSAGPRRPRNLWFLQIWNLFPGRSEVSFELMSVPNISNYNFHVNL